MPKRAKSEKEATKTVDEHVCCADGRRKLMVTESMSAR